MSERTVNLLQKRLVTLGPDLTLRPVKNLMEVLAMREPGATLTFYIETTNPDGSPGGLEAVTWGDKDAKYGTALALVVYRMFKRTFKKVKHK